MDWLKRMNNAINYIENNLEGKVDYEKAAREAFSSVYSFQRAFSFIVDVTLSEYIRRRKMTLAAFELQNSDIKVIELALKYGYESPEAFTRAFQLLHGVTPTEARNTGVQLKAYPRISFQISIKGVSEMNYRIEKKEAFKVYGIERIFDAVSESISKEVPEFWSELLLNGEYDELAKSSGNYPESDKGLCCVNAICDYRKTGESTFPYMLCVVENPKSKIGKYKVVEVPASTWAIFTTEQYEIENDSGKSIQALNERIYSEWLPTSNYEKIDGYDLEMYYGDGNGKGHCEVWIRVVSK